MSLLVVERKLRQKLTHDGRDYTHLLTPESGLSVGKRDTLPCDSSALPFPILWKFFCCGQTGS